MTVGYAYSLGQKCVAEGFGMMLVRMRRVLCAADVDTRLLIADHLPGRERDCQRIAGQDTRP